KRSAKPRSVRAHSAKPASRAARLASWSMLPPISPLFQRPPSPASRAIPGQKGNCRSGPVEYTRPNIFFSERGSAIGIRWFSPAGRGTRNYQYNPTLAGTAAMSEEQSFADFLRRIRAGDQDAAAELVRQYEPVIRLEVRRRLNDPSLAPL